MESSPKKILAVNENNVLFLVSILALFGYFILVVGYYLGSKINFKKERNYNKKPPYRKYQYWALIAFFVGMFGLVIEVQLQGGIGNSIKNIEMVRSFGISTSVKDGANNPLVFFRMFKSLIIFSFYTYFLLTRFTKDARYFLMSILTFVLSFYIIFIGGGKTHIIIFLVTVLAGMFFKPKKSKMKKMSNFKKTILSTLAISLGLISLVVLDPIFTYITFGIPIEFSTNNINSLVNQFSFPYSNGVYILSHDVTYRYFQDMFIWFISLLPSFITTRLGIPELTPLYEYNTVLQNYTIALGGIPSDIVTFGYYQLGITGIIVVFLIFGIIISRLDTLVWAFRENAEVKPLLLRVIIYIGMIVMYADLEGTFRNRYDAILLLFLLFDLRKYNFPGKTQSQSTNSGQGNNDSLLRDRVS